MTRDDEMRDEDRGAITGLLEAARAGRSGAADALFEAVYSDLKLVAIRLLAVQR